MDPKNGDATYDLSEMEEKYEVGSVGRSSPAVPEMEDSETEAVWSDGDINLVTGGGGNWGVLPHFNCYHLAQIEIEI